jgi:hypothetical protein
MFCCPCILFWEGYHSFCFLSSSDFLKLLNIVFKIFKKGAMELGLHLGVSAISFQSSQDQMLYAIISCTSFPEFDSTLATPSSTDPASQLPWSKGTG